MTTILITGADGQLGSEFKLLASNYTDFQVKCFNRSDWDITSANRTSEIIENENPDVIINCAAYTAVDKAESERKKAQSINERAVENLASVANDQDIYLIHFSTDYVFDGKKEFPYKENEETHPKSVYGKTKLAGEKHVLNTQKGLVLRVSWLFSTFGHNFLKTMLRLGSERDELKVVNDQVASPTYARLLANDVFELIENWNSGRSEPYGLFHYSHEGVASWFDFASFIFQLKQADVAILPVTSDQFPTAAERPAYSKLDNSKWKSATGFQTVHWKDAVKKCINDFK